MSKKYGLGLYAEFDRYDYLISPHEKRKPSISDNALFYFIECPTAPIPLSGNGTFSSLNYPVDKYPPSKNCFWIITAPIGKHVKVTIKDFRMGNCDNANLCQTPDSICSYLEFRDGPSAESSFLGRLCKGSVLSAKVSSGHQIFVKFHAGFSLDYGFQAEYSESLDEPTPTQTRPTTPTTPHITPKPPTESLDETTPTQTRRPTTTTTSTAPTTPHTTPKPPTTGRSLILLHVRFNHRYPFLQLGKETMPSLCAVKVLAAKKTAQNRIRWKSLVLDLCSARKWEVEEETRLEPPCHSDRKSNALTTRPSRLNTTYAIYIVLQAIQWSKLTAVNWPLAIWSNSLVCKILEELKFCRNSE